MKNEEKGGKLPNKKDRTAPDKSWRPGEDEIDYTNFKTFTASLQKSNRGKVFKNIAQASEDARVILKLVSYNTDEIVALAKRMYPKGEEGEIDEPEVEQPETEGPEEETGIDYK